MIEIDVSGIASALAVADDDALRMLLIAEAHRIIERRGDRFVPCEPFVICLDGAIWFCPLADAFDLA